MTLLVTGPIGSGKSEACRYLESRGYPVYDSDSRTKALYESVPGLKSRIEAATGLPFGEIAGIFSDKSKREALEAVVYPEVLADFEAWRAAQNSGVVVFESAIALSKPQFEGVFDKVLLITAPAETRAARNPKAPSRDASQPAISGADWTVLNDTTIENLYQKIETIISQL